MKRKKKKRQTPKANDTKMNMEASAGNVLQEQSAVQCQARENVLRVQSAVQCQARENVLWVQSTVQCQAREKAGTE